MSKVSKQDTQVNEDNICEIIELASTDIELLARAFKLIDSACAERVSEIVDELDWEVELADSPVIH